MLTPSLLIQKKRDGEELTRDEIRDFIRGITSGEVADYQATAFLMATFFRGMTLSETVALTEAMLESGERYTLSKVKGPKVDKHSTGGVGDKVSLILAPLAAACGLKVPMMAGRGLGHTGGTLDKLESIPGFNVHVSASRFEEILSQVGCAIIGQSDKIAPADKKLYALRDVTATVDCIPLITASILSKKLAEGADALVLDVKVGSGAFMETREDAKALSRTLIAVGKKLGLKVRVVLSGMYQPLGYAAGNAIEVQECIEILRCIDSAGSKSASSKSESGSGDLKELTIQLCAHMLELGGLVRSLAAGRKLAHSRLADGSAWRLFQEMVKLQGGSLESIHHPETLPRSTRVLHWRAEKRGYLSKIDTKAIGQILVEMGGGRKKASDSVDPSVGMVFHKKLGSRVKSGENLVTVYAPQNPTLAQEMDRLEALFQDSVEITGARKPVPKLILDILS